MVDTTAGTPVRDGGGRVRRGPTGLPGGGVRPAGGGEGTGHATRGLLARGLSVVCVEPDAHLAAILQCNLGAHARVVVGDLESYEPRPAAFDVLFGATSLHWISVDVLQNRADTALGGSGSVVSLTKRHTSRTEDGLFAEVQAVYERHAPELLLSAHPTWALSRTSEKAPC